MNHNSVSVDMEGKSEIMPPGISQNIYGHPLSKIPFKFTIYPLMHKLNLQFSYERFSCTK